MQFKKTGKYVKRDCLWLEQQMGLDGELKDAACQKASELIVSLLTNNEFFIISICTYNP